MELTERSDPKVRSDRQVQPERRERRERTERTVPPVLKDQRDP